MGWESVVMSKAKDCTSLAVNKQDQHSSRHRIVSPPFTAASGITPRVLQCGDARRRSACEVRNVLLDRSIAQLINARSAMLRRNAAPHDANSSPA